MQQIDHKKCALVLSGGAVWGSFQVGVLDYLINVLNADFNGFYGISVGALNTSLLVGASENGIKHEFNILKEVWTGIKKNKDIYKRRIHILPAELGALFQSIYIPKGLKKILSRYITNDVRDRIFSSDRELSIGVVSMEDGKINYLRNHGHDQTQLNEWKTQLSEYILASSSMPVLLPPVELTIDGDQKLCFDGGLRDVSPLGAAFKAEKYSDIFVINCSSASVNPRSRDKLKNGLGYLKRGLDIMNSETIKADINQAKLISNICKSLNLSEIEIDSRVYKDVNLHIVDLNISETKEFKFNHALDFDPEKIKKHIDYGFEYAKNLFEGKISFI